jgi:hypothetical protein
MRHEDSADAPDSAADAQKEIRAAWQRLLNILANKVAESLLSKQPLSSDQDAPGSQPEK